MSCSAVCVAYRTWLYHLVPLIDVRPAGMKFIGAIARTSSALGQMQDGSDRAYARRTGAVW